METATWDLDKDGFCLLSGAVPTATVRSLLTAVSQAFSDESPDVRARSSRGTVYAARNLIGSVPEVLCVWQQPPLATFLRQQLGEGFGLVRALYFDKPPERTWNLPWHKDTAVAVKDNRLASPSFSRPTNKAGVPHLIASDEVLRGMLTLRLHLDQVTNENGPLRVVPGSHESSTSLGQGLDRQVFIFAEAGDVLAMRPLISHASGPSQPGTTRHRRILHLEFAASAELPDGVQWHDFEKVQS